MMTTTYPNHAMQPQMAHPHPMAPGPNPGQPGMGHMQMHPGVSNQGGPVSQAGPMMGMQPGMGPNNHALQHLQPQQAAQLFQQQQAQQQMHMNPQLMQQQRNHQAFLRQQQQQMLQQQQNGMGMGFPTNMTSNMTPQHIAAMQGGIGGPTFANMPNLPPHLRALQQQQQSMHHNQIHQQQQQATSNPQAHAQAMAQAQAQAQHQAQQQQHAAHQAAQAQSQAQQQHAQQMQHTIAMQHAASQSSNHSQSGNQAQGPPTTTQPQAPLRPPSAIGSHQGQHSPAPPPTPQQPQQQGPPPPQQTPSQNPPQNGPQQPTPQAQNPQMQQRGQAMAQAQAAQAQAQAQAGQGQQGGPSQVQMQAMRLAMSKQALQQQQQGQGTLRLLNFIDQLGKVNTSRDAVCQEYGHWKQFVEKFFAQTGSFIHAFWLEASDRTKQFEIVYSAMPRYFYTLFTTDVESLQITIDGAVEKVMGSDIRVTCDRAKFIYTYKTPCPMQVVCRGKLTAYWAGSDKLEWLQFETENHQTFIQRAALEQMFQQPSPNQMLTQSPRMNKSSAKQRQNQQRMAENMPPVLKKSDLPAPDVTDMGIPPALQNYLEIYETMNFMTNLMVHYQDNNNMSPAQAMNSWVNQMSSTMGQPPNAGNAMHGGNMPQNMQQGARTPQAGGPGGQPSHQFMSPAMANQLLPNAAMNGSPHLMQQGHTPSPSSVPMGVSLSQQGSSATASVNTSPNVSNKRRRSTAKIDNDDGGGAAVNGASKTKPSPRIPKRAKGN